MGNRPLIRDFHLFLTDLSPILIRQFKDVQQRAKTQNKTLIIPGCRLVLPPELERETTVIEFALPGKQQLNTVLDGIMESAQLKAMETEQRDKMLDAASGLTTIKGERNCFVDLHHASYKWMVNSIIVRQASPRAGYSHRFISGGSDDAPLILIWGYIPEIFMRWLVDLCCGAKVIFSRAFFLSVFALWDKSPFHIQP